MAKMNYMLKTNDLVGYKNRKIFQCDKMISLSLDSLLLSNFVTIKKSTKKILDLGTGIGVIPLIVSLRTSALIDGVEIQEDVAKIASENVKLNKLDGQVNIFCDDMRRFSVKQEVNSYNIILCNPPYFNSGELSENKIKKISRYEDSINLEEIFKISRKLLKNKGVLALVFRTERLVEVLNLYRQYNIEPKTIRFIHHDRGKEAKLFFIEGSKNGFVGLKVLPPFILYDNGKKTREYRDLLNVVR